MSLSSFLVVLRLNAKRRFSFKQINIGITKVGCVFPMSVVSILPHPVFGIYDQWEDASRFKMFYLRGCFHAWADRI